MLFKNKIKSIKKSTTYTLVYVMLIACVLLNNIFVQNHMVWARDAALRQLNENLEGEDIILSSSESEVRRNIIDMSLQPMQWPQDSSMLDIISELIEDIEDFIPISLSNVCGLRDSHSTIKDLQIVAGKKGIGIVRRVSSMTKGAVYNIFQGLQARIPDMNLEDTDIEYDGYDTMTIERFTSMAREISRQLWTALNTPIEENEDEDSLFNIPVLLRAVIAIARRAKCLLEVKINDAPNEIEMFRITNATRFGDVNSNSSTMFGLMYPREDVLDVAKAGLKTIGDIIDETFKIFNIYTTHINTKGSALIRDVSTVVNILFLEKTGFNIVRSVNNLLRPATIITMTQTINTEEPSRDFLLDSFKAITYMLSLKEAGLEIASAAHMLLFSGLDTISYNIDGLRSDIDWASPQHDPYNNPNMLNDIIFLRHSRRTTLGVARQGEEILERQRITETEALDLQELVSKSHVGGVIQRLDDILALEDIGLATAATVRHTLGLNLEQTEALVYPQFFRININQL